MKLIRIGDSLTFGYGVHLSQRWTRLCAQETGWELVNEGINGAKTTKTLVREELNIQEFETVSASMRSASIRAATLSNLFLPIVVSLGSLATADGRQQRHRRYARFRRRHDRRHADYVHQLHR